MTITTAAGLIKKGLESEKPSWTAYLEDFLYYATDTGNLYYYNSSVRVLLQGPEKQEVLKNKTFNISDNNITGLILDPFISQKREGFVIPSITANSSLNFVLKGLPSNGNYSLVRDNTEGYISRFNNTGGENIGYFSDATYQLVTRRAYNPYLKVRTKSTDLTNINLMLGFSVYNPVPDYDWAIDDTHAGAILSFIEGVNNYIVRVSNGTNHNHLETSTVKNTDWHTYEIIMGVSDIVFKIDNIVVSTQTTNLPDLNTDIYLHIVQGKSTGTHNFDISKLYFRDDIGGI